MALRTSALARGVSADHHGYESMSVRAAKATHSLPPQSLERLLLADAQGELLAGGVIGDTGQFAQGLVHVLGPEADALRLITSKCLGIDGDAELLFVGGAHDPVAADAGAE